MNIALPPRFFYDAGKNNRAFVENGILYVEGFVNFEDLMYTLTYSIKGYDKCHYCGIELLHRKRTLDHMYPRVFGGISIPENLVPCCSNCNATKSCLTAGQFRALQKIPNRVTKEKAYRGMIAQNGRKFSRSYVLPLTWITTYDISTVIHEISFSEVAENIATNKKIEAFFDKYGRYPKPIVVSSNGWIFKGLHILYHAKNHSITTVSAIVLSNVVHLP